MKTQTVQNWPLSAVKEINPIQEKRHMYET